uniref:Uncharacterized protein n=1 Tax=Anopheles epiroticus TaxID=199890 RepID=A0A182P3J8_9DIPT
MSLSSPRAGQPRLRCVPVTSPMGDTSVSKRIRKKPSGILKLDSVRRRESSGSSLLQLGDEVAC